MPSELLRLEEVVAGLSSLLRPFSQRGRGSFGPSAELGDCCIQGGLGLNIAVIASFIFSSLPLLTLLQFSTIPAFSTICHVLTYNYKARGSSLVKLKRRVFISDKEREGSGEKNCNLGVFFLLGILVTSRQVWKGSRREELVGE